MAYFLNTGYSRRQIIINQMFLLLISHILITVYISLLMIVVGTIGYPDQVFIIEILKLNGYLFLLHLLLSSFAFFCAAYFNDIKYSVGLPAILTLVFVLLKMLSQVSDKISFIKCINPLSLFDPQLVINSDINLFIYLAILLIISLNFIGFSIKVFIEKDLHL